MTVVQYDVFISYASPDLAFAEEVHLGTTHSNTSHLQRAVRQLRKHPRITLIYTNIRDHSRNSRMSLPSPRRLSESEAAR
jgi:hypothetical protein